MFILNFLTLVEGSLVQRESEKQITSIQESEKEESETLYWLKFIQNSKDGYEILTERGKKEGGKKNPCFWGKSVHNFIII